MRHEITYRGARRLILALLFMVTAAAFALATGLQPDAWRVVGQTFESTTAQFDGVAPATDPVSIAVGLKFNNEADLHSLLKAQRTHGHPSYRRWLSSKETTEQFGPTVAQAQAVADYLVRNGFTNVKISPSRFLITADGTVASAQQAFNTQMGVYRDADGERGLANTSPIQVPAELSQVDVIQGLDTVTKMRVHQTASLLPGAAPYNYTDQFASIYNRPSNQTAENTVVAVTGSGDMNLSVNDLKQFTKDRGLPPVTTSIVPAQGSNFTSGVNSLRAEWSLDAEAIVGIAGKVKKLIFYTGNNAQPIAIFEQAVSDGEAKVINVSWATGGSGGCAQAAGSTVSMQSLNSNGTDIPFMRAALQGQTFTIAAGDNGALPCGVGAQAGVSYGTELGVVASNYAAYVGGTMLPTGATLAYGQESAWAWGGGGVSELVPKPDWQSDLGGSYRQVPDVAFAACSMIIFAEGSVMPSDFPSYPGFKSYETKGCGTSLSAPLFAGAWAVLQSANNNTLGFAPPLLYANKNQLYASSALHDVTTGNNGYYYAGVGYDNATGLGSFDIAKMLAFFAPNAPTYNIAASAGANGTISPTSITGVASGTTRPFTVKPNSGYYIASIQGCNGPKVTGNATATYTTAYTYTTGAITSACTVSATFAPINSATYTVTFNEGAGGMIRPAGDSGITQLATGGWTSSTSGVVWGTILASRITSNDEYSIASVSGCGGKFDSATRIFTTAPITANCTVSASFTPGAGGYTITASVSGGHGSITPGTITGVAAGTTRTFTVTPMSGYTASVTGTCGGTLSGNAFTTKAITSNCTVTANFSPLSYTVTASAGTGGTISPSGSSTVASGTTKSFTVTPNAGYYIYSISGCNGTAFTGTTTATTARTFTTGAITGACTVMANFSPLSYTVTASAGTGGTISPSGSSTVASGTTKSFTVTPNAGYYIASISGCNGTTVTGSNTATYTVALKYNTGAITGNCTVSATFALLQTYTITASAGANGTINPTGSITGVFPGATKVFTVTPSAGYTAAVSGTCGGTLNGTTFTTNAITSNCTVVANFSSPIVITASAGTGGTISPSGNSTVNYGTTKTFTVTPNAGYYIYSISGCSGTAFTGTTTTATTARTYTTGAITGACTVMANFSPLSYTVTANAGTGGMISPLGNSTVNYGTTKTFTVTPNAGYYIASISGCNGTAFTGTTAATAAHSYTTGAITASCPVSATFALLQTYTITASVGGAGGTISPSGNSTVNYGTTKTFTVTPSAGYYIYSISGCNGTAFTGITTTARTFTTGAITGNCTVMAYFSLLSYTVTASAGTGGTISPSGNSTVNYGTTKTFTVTPNAGYYIYSISGCNGTAFTGATTATTARTFTTGAITGNCTITAAFAPAGGGYTVTAIAWGLPNAAGALTNGGYVDTDEYVQVPSGATRTFTVTPYAGYYISSIKGCNGTPVTGNATAAAYATALKYNTGAITSNCTVEIYFGRR